MKCGDFVMASLRTSQVTGYYFSGVGRVLDMHYLLHNYVIVLRPDGTTATYAQAELIYACTALKELTTQWTQNSHKG